MFALFTSCVAIAGTKSFAKKKKKLQQVKHSTKSEFLLPKYLKPPWSRRNWTFFDCFEVFFWEHVVLKLNCVQIKNHFWRLKKRFSNGWRLTLRRLILSYIRTNLPKSWGFFQWDFCFKEWTSMYFELMLLKSS